MVSYVAANIDVMKWFWVKVIVQKVKLKEGGCIPRAARHSAFGKGEPLTRCRSKTMAFLLPVLSPNHA